MSSPSFLVNLKVDNFTIYKNSNIIYITGSTLKTIIRNGEVFIEKGTPVQLKFRLTAEILQIEKLLNASAINVGEIVEKILIRNQSG